jgi:hypothetical protein
MMKKKTEVNSKCFCSAVYAFSHPISNGRQQLEFRLHSSFPRHT